MGNGLPERDLGLCPQYRVLVSSKIIKWMFEADEVLDPVKKNWLRLKALMSWIVPMGQRTFIFCSIIMKLFTQTGYHQRAYNLDRRR